MQFDTVSFKNDGKIKLLIIVGTRPEIIRLSAVITKCRKYFKKFNDYVLETEEITEALGVCEESDAFQILLAHNPVYFKQYAAWGADLTLSGHLHGGIIRLPLIGGVITPQAKLFPRYHAGKYQIGKKTLIVSRGLGTHTIPIRFNNKPELSVIHLMPE